MNKQACDDILTKNQNAVISAKNKQEPGHWYALMASDIFRFPIFHSNSKYNWDGDKFFMELPDGTCIETRNEAGGDRLNHDCFLYWVAIMSHFIRHRTTKVKVLQSTFFQFAGLESRFEKTPYRTLRNCLKILVNTRIVIYNKELMGYKEFEPKAFSLLDGCHKIRESNKKIKYYDCYLSQEFLDAFSREGKWFLLSSRTLAQLTRLDPSKKFELYLYAFLTSRKFNRHNSARVDWEDLRTFNLKVKKTHQGKSGAVTQLVIRNINPLSPNERVGKAVKWLVSTGYIRKHSNDEESGVASFWFKADKEIASLPHPEISEQQQYLFVPDKYDFIDQSVFDESPVGAKEIPCIEGADPTLVPTAEEAPDKPKNFKKKYDRETKRLYNVPLEEN